MPSNAPIGIFDSGLGGLSVLRHIRALLPNEDLLYVADSGYAPYGDKTEEFVIARSLAIADFLVRQGAKALAVPCNTATAAAIAHLRLRYPTLPLVGVEPGLKPAAAKSKTHIVGVLATSGTLASAKFKLLREQISATSGVRFLPQACVGLADQVEKGELHSNATIKLIQRYVEPLIREGADTLVLGCTHYPFVQHLIEDAIKRATDRDITIIDTGEAVARQLARLLKQGQLLRQAENPGSLHAFTTGSVSSLTTAFAQLLKLHPPVTRIEAKPTETDIPQAAPLG